MDFSELYDRSYVPYSKDPAVALVHSTDGQWFPGIRIENISYPLSISASQNALFSCISEGHQPKSLHADPTDDPLANYWKQEFGLSLHDLDTQQPPATEFSPTKLSADTEIIEHLKRLLDQAHVEESNFPVSALVGTADGFYGGVNIECSAWNMGLCAERVAIAKALTYGSAPLQSLHIHTRYGEFSSPCGACRQVISEHLQHKQIHLHHADESESVHFSEDLLPHSFQSSSLSNQ